MNILFITNGIESYDALITDWLRSTRLQSKATPTPVKSESWDSYWKGGHRRICSRRDYWDASLRKLFADDSDTNYVLVVPELRWERDGTFDSGYEVAVDLLNEKVSGKFFNLFFVSVLTRDQLRGQVSPKYRSLVDAFQHFCLYDLPSQVEGIRYSRIHFEMIRRIAINETGRLDAIAHALAGIVWETLPEAKRKLSENLDILSLPVYSGRIKDGPGVLDALREQVGKLTDASGIPLLVDSLSAVVREVGKGLAKWTLEKERDSDGGKVLPEFKVLVIEDDGRYRKDLVAFLGGYFSPKLIHALSDDEIRTADIQMADLCRDYDVIFLDLMYCDPSRSGNAWLPFNGLDLYKTIIETDPDKVVRIITALPRNEIFQIVDTDAGLMTNRPDVITKSKGQENMKKDLAGKMEKILERCRENSKKTEKDNHYPTLGPFGAPWVGDWLETHKEELNDAVDYSRKVVMGKVMLASYQPPRVKDKEKFAEALPAILAHRRIVLAYLNYVNESTRAAGRSTVLNEQPEYDFEAFRARFVGEKTREKIARRDYFTSRLGFGYKERNDNGQTVFRSLNEENLFDFESAFIEEGNPLPEKCGNWARGVLRDIANPLASTTKSGSGKEYDELEVDLKNIFVTPGVLDYIRTFEEREDIPAGRFRSVLEDAEFFLKNEAFAEESRAPLQSRVTENGELKWDTVEEEDIKAITDLELLKGIADKLFKTGEMIYKDSKPMNAI